MNAGTPSTTQNPLVVLMGVSGSGKTTVGHLVAQRLGVPFADADDFHSVASREKMARGAPLTDADRAPWLEALRALLLRWKDEGKGGVLACSALRQHYRDTLDVGGVAFRLLTAPAAVLHTRLTQRQGHFFPLHLLGSQLATLEPDPAVPAFDTSTAPPEAIAAAVARSLR